MRADSAFGTVAVIQRLLELGYDFALKMFSGGNVNYKPFFDAIPTQQWIEVGKNRHASPTVNVPTPQLLGPYPLRLIALRRTDVDRREVRSIVVTTLAADAMPLTEMVTSTTIAKPSKLDSRSVRARSTLVSPVSASTRPTRPSLNSCYSPST